MPTLWLDADAAPRDVKEVCYRACDRLALETILVANQRLVLPVGYAKLSAVRVDGGADVADAYIALHAVAGDVVITSGQQQLRAGQTVQIEDVVEGFAIGAKRSGGKKANGSP